MSYARFVESDVYMYASCSGGIECCMCSIGPKVKSIWTTGTDNDYPLFKNIPACDKCEGQGCEECMISGTVYLETYEEAIAHLEEHVKYGHYVPERAFEGLREDMANNEPLDKICDGPMMVDLKKGEAMPLENWIEDQKGEEWKDENSGDSDDWKKDDD